MWQLGQIRRCSGVTFHLEREITFQIEQTGGVGSHYSDGRSGLVRLPLDWDLQKVG